MSIDERLQALTLGLQLSSREIEKLTIDSRRDDERIKALLSAAERRLRHREDEDS